MKTQYIEQYLSSVEVKAVDEINIDQKRISYNSEIIQHENIQNIRGEEEIVRAVIITKLVNEYEYKLDRLEIEEKSRAGSPHTNEPEADLLVKDDKGDVFMFMELKSPDKYEVKQDEILEYQLFNFAGLASVAKNYKIKYLVLATCDLDRPELPIRTIVIDREQYSTYANWKSERNASDKIPAHYGLAIKAPYVKGGNKDLDKDFESVQINAMRSNLHNVLWGGGSLSDNEIFNALVNLILAKIQDEGERVDGEEYQFQIKSYVDKSVKFETNEELYERINILYKRALKNKMHITDTEELASDNVISRANFPLSKLKYVVSAFEGYSFIDAKNSINGKDILGEFFEGIIRNGFKQDKGQFFTHTNIVKFIIWGLQIDKLAIDLINKGQVFPYAIDPSAGSGTFLIEYMKFITDCAKRRFKNKLSKSRDVQSYYDYWFSAENNENKWAKDFIYGIESNKPLARATKVNMILHGDGSTNIFPLDGLIPFSDYKKFNDEMNALNHEEIDSKYYSKKVNSHFDIVISNPPFNVDLDNDTKEERKEGFLFSSKQSSENLFIERYYQLLKENGRMGIVLPESFFDTVDNRYIRLFIFKYFKVKAVVSLPTLAFEPFTSTKTSLLFAQKKTKREIDEWDSLWNKYSSEYGKLATRCKNVLDVIINNKNESRLTSIKDLTEAEKKDLIVSLIENVLKSEDRNLEMKDLVIKYKEEILDLCKFDNDCSDIYGKVNHHWVFAKVAQELNYKIIMADVQEIGYKRTTRNIKKRDNELYRENEAGIILVDDGIESTVLDSLRKIDWD